MPRQKKEHDEKTELCSTSLGTILRTLFQPGSEPKKMYKSLHKSCVKRYLIDINIYKSKLLLMIRTGFDFSFQKLLSIGQSYYF